MALLSQAEAAEAQVIIRNTAPGFYELRDIYGLRWSAISSPTSFGARFKATVRAGALAGISVHELKTNNHRTYEILG